MATLPGLSDSLQPLDVTSDPDVPQRLAIPLGSEWRVEVPQDSKLQVKILSGIAEIFGTELAIDIEYTFQNTNFSIYAVEATELEWKCLDLANQSISSNTNLKHIYNLHFSLEKLRVSSFEGPRVLIVGESSSGKTTLAKYLCSYAIKFKPYEPVMVNLNPQEGIFSPPGCLSATPISDILDVSSNTWGQSMTSGATQLHSKQPIVKNFGLENISDNRELYMRIIQQLSEVLSNRFQSDPMVRRSGCVIDTPPFSHFSDDFSELHEIIKLFRITAIVVCAHDDNLAVKINDVLMSQTIPIVRVPTSNGVVQVSDVFKRSLQRSAIKDYFYGDLNTVLSPYTIGVDFDMITVWQPRSALNTDSGSEALYLPVETNASNLQHALVAITYAPRRAPVEEVIDAPILGFALIMEVNDTRKKLRILLPVPGRLPDKALILTAYRYLE
ncbi:LAFE_0G08284g1_1 [Lachancea fermentati]|uniref:Polynucleotide 5'-hydroxyl-kinase GRC3 n=1 Tax=Lachancea fermentati TaxID=4955 RepID=A0A1G4MHX5_LACFM|nr:LAFE_0G08284g1_1 [Lachancea fermentati]